MASTLRTTTLAALAVGTVAAVHLATSGAAYAGRPGGAYGPAYVVAESEFGNGTVRGAIRPGRHGWQVRMPRGTWIDCVRSCSDTLRRETVDFWETRGPNGPGSGRGYLSFEFRW